MKKTIILVVISIVIILGIGLIIIASLKDNKSQSKNSKLNVDTGKILEKQGEITTEDLEGLLKQTGSF
jgi:flagellar basal body-associated protein FliL